MHTQMLIEKEGKFWVVECLECGWWKGKLKTKKEAQDLRNRHSGIGK